MKFIEDVVSGKLLLGNYARLAVERHLNDLKIRNGNIHTPRHTLTGPLTLYLPSGILKVNLLGKGLTSNLSRSFS